MNKQRCVFQSKSDHYDQQMAIIPPIWVRSTPKFNQLFLLQ